MCITFYENICIFHCQLFYSVIHDIIEHLFYDFQEDKRVIHKHCIYNAKLISLYLFSIKNNGKLRYMSVKNLWIYIF